MGTTSSDSAAYRHGQAGYGASQPHASLSQYHDRESFVAAIEATFGVAAADPAPASQSGAEHADLATSIAEQLDARGGGLWGGGEARAPETAALDLIEKHKSEDENNRILLKTESYPNGARRVVIRRVAFDKDPKWEAGLKGPKREKSEQERVDSSKRRTRKVIQQRCLSFKADRLLTLTYRENMEDRERAYQDTIKFIQRCQAANLLPKYVAVPEKQKRGAWHIHIACRGFMWVQTLRRIWRGIVGPDNGNIDMSYRHRNENNPWRIASYLGKYIGKAIEQNQPGERTFWASEWGGQQPVIRASLLPFGITFTQVQLIISQLLEEKRIRGEIEAIDGWQPPWKDGKPPGVAVFWAA